MRDIECDHSVSNWNLVYCCRDCGEIVPESQARPLEATCFDVLSLSNRATLRRLHRQHARLARLEADLLALTPGGSEFHGSPERCLEFIRDRLGTVVEQVRKRKAAEAECEWLREVLGSAVAFIKCARYELKDGGAVRVDQFPCKDDATMEIAKLQAALTGQPEREGG